MHSCYGKCPAQVFNYDLLRHEMNQNNYKCDYATYFKQIVAKQGTKLRTLTIYLLINTNSFTTFISFAWTETLLNLYQLTCS